MSEFNEPWRVGFNDGSGQGREHAHGEDRDEGAYVLGGDREDESIAALDANMIIQGGRDEWNCRRGATTKNSERIVACVNACAGIPTEKLESEIFYIARAYHTIQGTVDELLIPPEEAAAALKKLLVEMKVENNDQT